MTNEEAIKNIVAYIYYAEDIPEEVGKAFDKAVEVLKTERPHGEWIFVSRGCYKCPFCQDLSRGGNFCPNCGAVMKKTEGKT